MSTRTRAKKRGMRWEGQYQVGCYWFPVKKNGRVVTFGTRTAARAAAEKALPNFRTAA